MIYLLWLIPILIGLISFIIYKDVLVWKITGASLVVIIIYSLVHQSILKDGLTSDTEWWGNYATGVHYYDDWNEKVSCRHPIYCTTYSTDSKGRTTSHTYVCGHEHAFDVDYHSEYWTMRYDNKSEESISKSTYIYWSTLWGNKFYKIELNRDYYTNDGDDEACDWDLNPVNSNTLITEHTYVNKVQASNSVFKADNVDSVDVKQYHLFEYPKCNTTQQIVLGSVKIDNITDKLLKYINGYYGSKKQFKLFICCYRNQSEITAERQHSYWGNLNKNELLICIGLDNANQIQWCKSYSWMDKPILGTKVEQWFKDNKSLNLYQFANWLPKNIEEYWSRKHFKDFNYIQINLQLSQYVIIFSIVLILSLIQFIIIYKIMKLQ